MNLAQVIHQLWAADVTLQGLLPATSNQTTNKVHTGEASSPDLPYAVLDKISQVSIAHCNDGRSIDRVALRFQVFHDNHDDGKAIADAIKAAFHRTDFDLAGTDRVINMQRAGDSEAKEEDGVWRFMLDFTCLIDLTAGV